MLSEKEVSHVFMIKFMIFLTKIEFLPLLMSPISPKHTLHIDCEKFHWPPILHFGLFVLTKLKTVRLIQKSSFLIVKLLLLK